MSEKYLVVRPCQSACLQLRSAAECSAAKLQGRRQRRLEQQLGLRMFIAHQRTIKKLAEQNRVDAASGDGAPEPELSPAPGARGCSAVCTPVGVPRICVMKPESPAAASALPLAHEPAAEPREPCRSLPQHTEQLREQGDPFTRATGKDGLVHETNEGLRTASGHNDTPQPQQEYVPYQSATESGQGQPGRDSGLTTGGVLKACKTDEVESAELAGAQRVGRPPTRAVSASWKRTAISSRCQSCARYRTDTGLQSAVAMKRGRQKCESVKAATLRHVQSLKRRLTKVRCQLFYWSDTRIQSCRTNPQI